MVTEVEGFSIKVPIYVMLGKVKKKKHYLNLNLFRNQEFHINNNIKKEFKRIVTELIPDVYYSQFELHYTLYLPNKLKRDISNVLSIVDKNFCDAFIELGRAEDDNYEFLKKVIYEYGGQDPDGDGYAIINVTKVE